MGRQFETRSFWFFISRHTLLHLHGNVGRFLYECDKHFGRYKRAWSWSIVDYCSINHCIQLHRSYSSRKSFGKWILSLHYATVFCYIVCAMEIQSVSRINRKKFSFSFLEFEQRKLKRDVNKSVYVKNELSQRKSFCSVSSLSCIYSTGGTVRCSCVVNFMCGKSTTHLSIFRVFELSNWF